MPDGSFIDIYKIITIAGGSGVLAMFTLAWLRGWIVTGGHMEQARKDWREETERLRKDIDFWKEAALRDINNTDRLLDAAHSQQRTLEQLVAALSTNAIAQRQREEREHDD